MTEHGIQPDDFLDFVHEIDHSPLEPNPALGARDRAAARPQADPHQRHARARRAVLARLGIDRHFEDVFDIVAADLDAEAAAADLRPLPRARTASTRRSAAMFEDLARNLEVPHALGMTTVLVVPDGTARGVARGLGAGRPRRAACRSRHRRSGRISARGSSRCGRPHRNNTAVIPDSAQPERSEAIQP